MSANRRKLSVGTCLSALLVMGSIPYAYASGKAPATHLASSTGSSNTQDASYEFNNNDYTLPEVSVSKVPSPSIPATYQRISQTKDLALYVNKETLGMMIENLRTGYVWSTIPSAEELKKEQLNTDWQALVESPLVVNYFTPDAMVNTGGLGSLGGQIENFRLISGGFTCRLNMINIEVSVQLVVKLSDHGLVVELPEGGIEENGPDKLASLEPYPFLGAVHEQDIPGYMFIPDGSGALVRFTKTHPSYDTPFSGQIYGNDVAADTTNAANANGPGDSSASSSAAPNNSNPAGQVYMPVFGMVHGVNQNGFLAIVEKGKYDANIVAYPSGVSTNLNWVSAQFILRHQYFQPTSQNMGGFTTFQKNRVNGDLQIRYIFLSGQTANYVGMATTYQSYLQQTGGLQKREKTSSSIPLHIEFLGSETKPGMFGSQTVDMTTFTQAKSIMNDLVKKGMRNMVVVYRGWDDGGLTGQNPNMFSVEKSLGGTVGLQDFEQYLKKRSIPLYLYSDFTDAYRNTGEFNIGVSAVRDITNQIVKQPAMKPIETTNTRLANISLYYINPGTAENIAKDAAASWKGLGVQGIAINQTGFNLFSDYNSKHPYTRRQAVTAYQNIAALMQRSVGPVSWYSPNDYVFKSASQIFNTPMNSSQYMYETDTVPFVQIVLHGYIDYFAPFSNFEADPQEELLKAIDYGAYPSFYMTYSPSWTLKDTPSEDIFTSRYADWTGEIRTEYTRANKALRIVQGATLVNRSVPAFGVVLDTYSNGVKLVVNYRYTPVTVNQVRVEARDFAVEGGK